MIVLPRVGAGANICTVPPAVKGSADTVTASRPADERQGRWAGAITGSRLVLQVPPLLTALLASRRWKHPGDEALVRVVPLLVDPVDLRDWLPSKTVGEEIAGRFAPRDMQVFKMYRDGEPERPIPWLNVDRAQFIAVNRIPGDDVAIALDYRLDINHPRLVASHWCDGKSLEWFDVSENFESFARLLGLGAA